MDFFSEQDQARSATKKLVFLFLLSVLILLLLTNILVAFVLQIYHSYNGIPSNFFTLELFSLTSLAVTSIIACAVFFKWLQLSAGGKRVAEQLGGGRILPNTNNDREKRVLNVVEEMAIASGMPVPSVYLLDQEHGINAFAAGNTPADAVIGVTKGCVDQFNREQLQGVIAHEFSHILNGDMRLNIRLIAILNGILFVGLIGEVLTRSQSTRSFGISSHRRSGSDGRLLLLGVAFLVIGWLGKFFGNWIKSAVSRQREFLADASAVQFTRNPQGIADALKIIGGYHPSALLETPKAGEMSHLFFGQASHLSDWFATHPPLEERIVRIDSGWDGNYIFREPVESNDSQSADESNNNSRRVHEAVLTSTVITAQAAAQSLAGLQKITEAQDVNDVREGINTIPKSLTNYAHDPLGAIAIVFGLLLSEDKSIQQKQLEYILQAKMPGLSVQTVHLHTDLLNLDKSLRLPLIEMLLPALKCISAPQYTSFSRTMLLLIRADQQFELFEWCLYQLVKHYLDPEFKPVKVSKPIYKKVESVASEFQLILSLMVHHGENCKEDVEKSFSRGANTAGLYNIEILDKGDCTMNEFVRAVNKLANCYPLIKPRLLKGLADSAKHDGKISVVEQELIAAIAAVMDCPMPLIKTD